MVAPVRRAASGSAGKGQKSGVRSQEPGARSQEPGATRSAFSVGNVSVCGKRVGVTAFFSVVLVLDLPFSVQRSADTDTDTDTDTDN